MNVHDFLETFLLVTAYYTGMYCRYRSFETRYSRLAMLPILSVSVSVSVDIRRGPLLALSGGGGVTLRSGVGGSR